MLDEDMDQYIHDNTDDEISHFTFLNAYVQSLGGTPSTWISFAPCRAARRRAPSKSDGSRTSCSSPWTPAGGLATAATSRTPIPFNDTFAQAVPTLAVGQHPAIPRTDADPTDPNFLKRSPTRRLPLRVDRARWHQPLRRAGSEGHQSGGPASPAQHRPNRDDALSDLERQGRPCGVSLNCVTRTGWCFPTSTPPGNSQDQPDHARADRIPRSEVPDRLDHPADRDRRGRDGRGQAFTADGLFIGQSSEFFAFLERWHRQRMRPDTEDPTTRTMAWKKGTHTLTVNKGGGSGRHVAGTTGQSDRRYAAGRKAVCALEW